MEIVRGPESALFGAEAAAGVIQLFTKHGDPENAVPHGAFSYERGKLPNRSLDREPEWRPAFAHRLCSERVRISHRRRVAEHLLIATIPERRTSATRFRNPRNCAPSSVCTTPSHGTPGQIAYGIDDPVPNEESATNRFAAPGRQPRLKLPAAIYVRFSAAHRSLQRQRTLRPAAAGGAGAERRRASAGGVFGGAGESVQSADGDSARPFAGANHQLFRRRQRFAESDGTKNRGISGHVVRIAAAHWSSATIIRTKAAMLSGIAASRTNNGFFANVQQNFGKRIFLSGGARVEHSSAFGTIGSGRGGASFLLLGEHGPLSSTFVPPERGARRHRTQPARKLRRSRHITSAILHCVRKPPLPTRPALVSEWWGRRVRTEVAAFRNSFRRLDRFRRRHLGKHRSQLGARGGNFGAGARHEQHPASPALTCAWTPHHGIHHA